MKQVAGAGAAVWGAYHLADIAPAMVALMAQRIITYLCR
jgi:hypothetical protein